MSSLVLGRNEVEIRRGMTTSATAIFVPFITRELRMGGQALYYGCLLYTSSYTARFLHIRPALEAVGRAADKAATDCDRTTADLRKWSATYHAVSYTHLDVYKRQEFERLFEEL